MNGWILRIDSSITKETTMTKDWTKIDRATLTYLDVILGEITDFENLLTTAESEENKRRAFHKLMTLTLGSSRDWKRVYVVSGKCHIAPGTLRRYVTHTSAPVSFAYPHIAQDVRTVIKEEYMEIEKIVLAAEKVEKREVEKSNREFKALVDRVVHIVPDTFYNCQATFENTPEELIFTPGDYPLSVGISYPCRGLYNFDDHFPYICTTCDEKDKAPLHGRVILNGEDGLMLLPHIICTQEDVFQAMRDIETANIGCYYFKSKEAGERWYAGCKNFMETNDFIATLPRGEKGSRISYDLTKEKLMWIF